MELKKRFEIILNNYTSDTILIEELWAELQENYTASFRAYHNLTHLEEIFNYFDTYNSQIENPNELALAIFYHDAIYNIWKKDNEEKSAELANNQLKKLAINVDVISRIEKHIIATKSHQAILSDSKWMVDFDLAILGQSEKVYNNYTSKIREEYKVAPNLLYYSGRKKVLQHFLNKKSIYTSDVFIELYEENARKNLLQEIKTIQNR